MVRGIEKFKEYFEEYAGQYVFIGGTACDIILGKMGAHFRQTKDLDMVLIIEALNDDFTEKFITFIKEAGYQHINKGTGKEQFYRFEKPVNPKFPYMIELFSRTPDYFARLENRIAPIHISEESVSLSAILLDEEYYSLLVEGREEVEGISVLKLEHLILFKMKAWLDLSERKEKGENVDSKNIKKHKNDILRLASNIDKDSFVDIHGKVRRDAENYIRHMKNEEIDVNHLEIHGVTYREILEQMKRCYSL